MEFHHVAIDTVVHVDAPIRLTSADVVRRLQPALDRWGIRGNLLEDVAGIHARRVWDGPMQVADAATMAAREALARSGVPPERIGVLISTSVSRDYLEPSTASVVHGNVGLSSTCQNFDVGNACLAFLSGMDIAGRMIERGEIEYALIVDGEVSNEIIERTVDRLSAADATADQFRAEFASLTLGSGAAAMVLGNRDQVVGGHRYLGGVTRAATAYSHLCRGNMDRMVTDTRMLLEEGLKLAATTFQAAGWAGSAFDEYVVHQVSRVHTDALVKLLDIDPARVLTVFGEHGNIGPAAVPIALSKLNEMGRLHEGMRVALMGIGSGLNCSMAEVVW
ncbi:MAG TPA: 3-oxoacyl-ACP synthase III [Micromonosporaceae bacterium]|nr:3-oxoacyl-ACP synthase III [Micromonosporaceae bacterium]